MTATEVSVHPSIHKTKVSRAVAMLERRKWLMREPSDTDRRVEHLRLTKAGSAACQELVPLARAFEARMLGGLADDDRRSVLTGHSILEELAVVGD